MGHEKGQLWPWRILVSELIGTALLVFFGLSLVILMFGAGNPFAPVFPNETLRRLITGFLFGTTGALIALSPIGKVSGAHINPIVSMAFWLMGKLDSRITLGYVLAQLAGACLGVLPLLAWGSMGSKHGVWRDLAGRRLFSSGGPAGRGHHYLSHGGVVGHVFGISPNSALYSSSVSLPLCPHGLRGGPDFRHQHESSPQFWARLALRSMAGMVDLLDWSADRQPCGVSCVQFPGEADRGCQSVSFRN